MKSERVELWHGNSTEYVGQVDLVLTNPYAPLPPQLRKTPMLICDFADRHALAESRCGTLLEPVSPWYGGVNMIWAGNMGVIPVDLSDLNPDSGGFFPDELVRRLLEVYGSPEDIVWDGFMGRGTVGKVCLEMGMDFIGIDQNLDRVKMAEKYVFG